MSEDLKHLLGKKFRTVGDKNGKKIFKARIICVDADRSDYTIVALVVGEDGIERPEIYTKDLKYITNHSGSYRDLVEVNPYEDFKIDDPVVCWTDKDPKDKRKRYFAGLSHDGKPTAFNHGATSFSDKGNFRPMSWDHCISKEEYEKRLNEGTL